MSTEQTIIKTGTIASDWYKSTAPNGCLSIIERRLTTITIFEADYYGNGARRYVSGFDQIEIKDGGIGPRSGGWVDGDPERVAKWEAQIPRDEIIATPTGDVRVTQICNAFPRDRRFDDSECPDCDSGIGVQMTNSYLTGIEADCDCLFDVAMIAKLEAWIERQQHEADADENGYWGAAERAYDNWKDSRC